MIEDILYSEKFACPECGMSIDELAPRLFSFNSPFGKCDHCDGLGTLIEIDENLVIPNKDLSILEGAIVVGAIGVVVCGVVGGSEPSRLHTCPYCDMHWYKTSVWIISFSLRALGVRPNLGVGGSQGPQ